MAMVRIGVPFRTIDARDRANVQRRSRDQRITGASNYLIWNPLSPLARWAMWQPPQAPPTEAIAVLAASKSPAAAALAMSAEPVRACLAKPTASAAPFFCQ